MKPQYLPLLALVLLITGCSTTSSLNQRISSNPELFNDLSSEQRELVYQGRIAEGMPREAVYMAWGKASRVQTGSDGGKETEVWLYDTWQPVRHRTIGVGVGFGYPGYYNRIYGYSGYGYGAWPSYYDTVDYVRYPDAQVRFVNGKVSAWRTEHR